MKTYLSFILLFSIQSVFTSSYAQNKMKTIHNYTVKDINGNDFSFSSLKGKKILIVNTASECGLTPQYMDLEELYEKYKNSGFVIVGFPANNFGAQEPGSNLEIKSFCTKNYGVTFPMMSKISVKGSDAADIYKWLCSKELNGVKDVEVTWNFQKFMIDENGYFVDFAAPQILPNAKEIVDWIEKK